MSPGSAHNSIKELQKMRKRAGHQVAAYNIVMLCSINVTESCPTACSYFVRPTRSEAPSFCVDPSGASHAADCSRGLPIAALSRQATATLMVQVEGVEPRGSPAAFTSANGEVISKCSRFAEFRRLFSDAWLVSADGQLLVTASRLLANTGLRNGWPRHDLFHDVARIAIHRDLSFAIYGATADENAKALCSIRKSYPQVRITRSSHGYLTEGEQRKFVAEVAAARTDILWVCLGVPLLQMATEADRGGRRQVRRRPSQFSFRQLPTSPASDPKSRIGVAIQGRDGAETAVFSISVHESSCGYSPFISNRKISLNWRQFIQERKSGNIVETKHSAAQEEPDPISSVK